MSNNKKFNKILQYIKSVKIQGARNIAKAALFAYQLNPSEESRSKLLKARETEPMLFNIMKKIQTRSYEKILYHFDEAQEKINHAVFKFYLNRFFYIAKILLDYFISDKNNPFVGYGCLNVFLLQKFNH